MTGSLILSITIGIFVNPRKKQVQLPLEQLNAWIEQESPEASFLLRDYDSPYTEESYSHITYRTEREILDAAHVILTLGGDGTILRTVKAIGPRGIPVLGVNLGGLGFLADTPPEGLLDHVQAIIEGRYLIEERSLLRCRINNGEQSFTAFNDFVIDKAGFSRVIEINTVIDGHLLNSYIADALILSTPSGSTGYSLSAGGPIVIPQTNVFIINPICPHSLTNRPVVIPDTSHVQIRVATEHKEVSLICDGLTAASLPSGTELEFTKADYSVKLVKMQEREFFETMRSKLRWGEDFRNKNRWSYHNSEPE